MKQAQATLDEVKDRWQKRWVLRTGSPRWIPQPRCWEKCQN